MNAQSPSAYSLSLLLHGAFAVAILFVAYAFRDESMRNSAKILELVTGPGDNWQALEAPAAGSPDAVKFSPAPVPRAVPVREIPPAPVPPEAEPPLPSPSPISAVTAPVEPPAKPTPLKPTAAKTPPPPKSFTQQIQQTAARREKQIVKKFRSEEAAREKKEAQERAKAAKAAELARKPTTFDEFEKNSGKKIASNSKTPANFEKISTKGIADGVEGGSTDKPGAGGKALSREEQDLLDTYIEALKQKVKAAHVPPPGAYKGLAVRISLFLAVNGAIGQVKVDRSSGNAEFDQSVVQAFRSVTSIGRRPDGRSDSFVVVFVMADPE